MKKEEFTYDVEKYSIVFYSQLSEREKRIYAGLEAMRAGYNGVSEVSKKYGIHKHTVRKGKKELESEIVPASGYIRKQGGGRKKKQ